MIKIKKIILTVISMAAVFSFSGCSRTYYNDKELIESARDVIPLSDIKNIDIRIAGKTETDDKALVWFVTGNEYQNNSYFPIEYDIVGEGGYKLYHFYNTHRQCAENIDMVQWNVEYYNIIIENPECKKLIVTSEEGTNEFDVTEDNNIFNIKIIDGTTKYSFIDENGNEIY